MRETNYRGQKEALFKWQVEKEDTRNVPDPLRINEEVARKL